MSSDNEFQRGRNKIKDCILATLRDAGLPDSAVTVEENGDDAPVTFRVDGYTARVDINRPDVLDCATGMEPAAHTMVRALVHQIVQVRG